MNESYQVPKDAARVTLHPPGVEVEVFLSRNARLHGGHETISDLVTDPEKFLPVREDGRFTLFRKDRLDWVLVHDPLETEEGFFETSGYAHRIPVSVTFEHGARLEGVLVVVTPEEASRLSDVVNSDRTWVHFESDTAQYLVNLDRVSSIAPAGTP